MNSKLHELDKFILLTLAYPDQFKFPLTAHQVWLRLIKLGAEFDAVQSGLNRLIECKLIVRNKDYYFLSGRKETCKIRDHRQLVSNQKWQETKQIVRVLSWVPFVQTILVTGALAVDNTPENDDIDLMIITQPHTLWLTRVIVLLIAALMGKRRSWQREEPNSWCFNLWVDQANLVVPRDSQSIYTAYELLQAEPIYDWQESYHRWLKANSWVTDFLPNYYNHRFHQSVPEKEVKYLFELYKLLTPINWLSRILQAWYMKSKRTREIVGRGVAYFHPRDTYGLVMRRWWFSVKKLQSKVVK